MMVPRINIMKNKKSYYYLISYINVIPSILHILIIL